MHQEKKLNQSRKRDQGRKYYQGGECIEVEMSSR